MSDHHTKTLSLGTLAYTAVVAVGSWLRLARLGWPPLTDSEAVRALAAAAGTPKPSAFWLALPPTDPAYSALTSVLLQALGSKEFVVRIIPAIAGIGVLLLPWMLRKRIGTGAAFVAACLLAISPVMLASSRTAGGSSLAVLGGFLALACVFGTDFDAIPKARLGIAGRRRAGPGFQPFDIHVASWHRARPRFGATRRAQDGSVSTRDRRLEELRPNDSHGDRRCGGFCRRIGGLPSRVVRARRGNCELVGRLAFGRRIRPSDPVGCIVRLRAPDHDRRIDRRLVRIAAAGAVCAKPGDAVARIRPGRGSVPGTYPGRPAMAGRPDGTVGGDGDRAPDRGTRSIRVAADGSSPDRGPRRPSGLRLPAVGDLRSWSEPKHELGPGAPAVAGGRGTCPGGLRLPLVRPRLVVAHGRPGGGDCDQPGPAGDYGLHGLGHQPGAVGGQRPATVAAERHDARGGVDARHSPWCFAGQDRQDRRPAPVGGWDRLAGLGLEFCGSSQRLIREQAPSNRPSS